MFQFSFTFFIHPVIIIYKVSPVQVHIAQRVVQAVGVTVEPLGAVGLLHLGVGAEETPQGGVVEPGVHVHQPAPRQVLVTGEAAPQQHRLGTISPKIL